MANNVSNYISSSSSNPLDLTSASLKHFLSDTSKILMFPPGLGGNQDDDTSTRPRKNASLPFILFAPFKRKAGPQNIRTNVLDELPPPSFAIALPLPTSALKTSYGVEYQPVQMGAEMELIADRFSNIDIQKLMTSYSGAASEVMRVFTDKDTAQGALTGAAAGVIGGLPSAVGSYLSGGAVAAAKDLAGSALRPAIAGSIAGGGATQAAMFSTIKNLLNKNMNANMSDSIMSSAGFAENPFTEQVFKNVKLREFTYTFVFMPRNEKEAKTVDDIIQLFKFYMLPAYANFEAGIIADKISTAGAFFSYPYEFQITYSVQDTTFSLLPSILTNMVVSYNEGMDSPKFFVPSTSGKQYPTKTNLTLSFTEVMIMSRDKVLINEQKFKDPESSQAVRVRF